MFQFRNVAHMLLVVGAGLLFTATALFSDSWAAIIIAFVIGAFMVFGDVTALSALHAWRRHQLKKSVLPYACVNDMANAGWSRGSTDLELRCLERRAAFISKSCDIGRVLPYIRETVTSHESQHDYVRQYIIADVLERLEQRAFWKALAESSYSRDAAEELVWEHGFAVALKAVELDLPVEYAASLA